MSPVPFLVVNKAVWTVSPRQYYKVSEWVRTTHALWKIAERYPQHAYWTPLSWDKLPISALNVLERCTASTTSWYNCKIDMAEIQYLLIYSLKSLQSKIWTFKGNLSCHRLSGESCHGWHDQWPVMQETAYKQQQQSPQTRYGIPGSDRRSLHQVKFARML